MSRADDLVPLLTGAAGADGAPPVKFRQGVVTAWNPNTGANTIDVQGVPLVNVPMLNTGEAIALKPGHVVGLLMWGYSWFILGRVTVPGDPDFASASVAFGGEGNTATNFGLSTALVNKVTDTMAVPDWADEAIVLCTANCSLHNTRGVADFAQMVAVIDGVSGGGSLSGFAANGDAGTGDWQTMQASAQRRITGVGSSISLAAQIQSNGAAWAADAANIVNLDAIAVFRSSV